MIIMKKINLFIFNILLFALFTLFNVSNPSAVNAQQSAQNEEKMEATITSIKDVKIIEVNGKDQLYQKLELLINNGRLKDKKVIVENGKLPVTNIREYEKGDKVVITVSKDINGKDTFYITDYVRRGSLYLLFAIFAGLTILIGGKRGIASLFGMGLSFGIIFLFILPQISNGKDPIMVSIIASLFIIPITFFLSHGINRKTTIAVLGTLVALIFTGVLANYFVDASRLTGFASEEASFLQAAKPGLVNIQALILAGVIIGVLGILDDISIAQAGVVYQLKETSPNIEYKELYRRAMNIGKDHIASMVNTLVLVYTGAALPLLLLFINNPQPFSQVINLEIIAEEIIRTLVASIGLILTVPITTAFAVFAIELERTIKESKE
jgi:uncharacterized membrane protein